MVATKYHTGLFTNGLYMEGVGVVFKWAAVALDASTALLYLALCEKHTTSRFDVS